MWTNRNINPLAAWLPGLLAAPCIAPRSCIAIVYLLTLNSRTISYELISPNAGGLQL